MEGNNHRDNGIGHDLSSLFGSEDAGKSRCVIRLNVLNRAELVRYAKDRWLSSSSSSPTSTQAAASQASTNTGDKTDDRIRETNEVMDELNKRGLVGLNEAILETRSGKRGMCLALQIVTLYREAQPNRGISSFTDGGDGDDDPTTSIVFHCVQGKDR